MRSRKRVRPVSVSLQAAGCFTISVFLAGTERIKMCLNCPSIQREAEEQSKVELLVGPVNVSLTDGTADALILPHAAD